MTWKYMVNEIKDKIVLQQDKQCIKSVTWRRVHVAIVAVEKQ
jgi:hypothetical protein